MLKIGNKRRRTKNKIRESEALTGEIWHRLELFFPVLGDLDGFGLLARAVGGHSHRVGVDEELLQVVGLHRV